MNQFTPPGLYDVSIALLRTIAATFERHERRRLPVIAYHAESRAYDADGHPAESLPPILRIDLYRLTDVPPAFRRWFLDCPFAIAIPESVWHACPAHLIDYDQDGDVIVQKERWDGPGLLLPTV